MPTQDLIRPDNQLARAAIRARLGFAPKVRSRMRLDLIGLRKVVTERPAEPPAVVIEAEPEPAFVPFDFLTLPSMRTFVRYVALKHGVTPESMVSEARSTEVTRARHEAMFLIRTHMDKSTTEIGRLFGGRDHTSVIHAIRMARQRRSAC